MVTNLSDLDLNGTYSYADYVTWQFTELVELVRGHILKMAAPRTAHQKISMKFSLRVGSYAEKCGCSIFHAPFDVRLLTNPAGKRDKDIYTVVQPDICVICDPTKIDERGAIGAPDWIIEIVSPSTLDRDRFLKRDLYEEHGVAEYWIVYPNEKFIDTFYMGENGRYDKPQTYILEIHDSVSPAIFPDLSMNLADIFG